MSCYSGFEITIDKIKLDDDTILKLKDIVGCVLSGYENIEDRIEKEYLRYHKAFNYDSDRLCSTLSLLEPYLIESDEVVEIGTSYNENEEGLTGVIYTWKSKIYIVYLNVYSNWGFPDDYVYHTRTTDGKKYTNTYADEVDLKVVFTNHITTAILSPLFKAIKDGDVVEFVDAGFKIDSEGDN